MLNFCNEKLEVSDLRGWGQIHHFPIDCQYTTRYNSAALPSPRSLWFLIIRLTKATF